MIEHFSRVLNGECSPIHIVLKSDLQAFLFPVLDIIFSRISRLFETEPIWNFFYRQLFFSSFDIAYDFNVRAPFDFCHLQKWSNYICGWNFIRRFKSKFIATRRVAKRKKSIASLLKLWNVAELSGIFWVNESKNFDHLRVV